jgi:hypothetical protein
LECLLEALFPVVQCVVHGEEDEDQDEDEDEEDENQVAVKARSNVWPPVKSMRGPPPGAM